MPKSFLINHIPSPCCRNPGKHSQSSFWMVLCPANNWIFYHCGRREEVWEVVSTITGKQSILHSFDWKKNLNFWEQVLAMIWYKANSYMLRVEHMVSLENNLIISSNIDDVHILWGGKSIWGIYWKKTLPLGHKWMVTRMSSGLFKLSK